MLFAALASCSPPVGRSDGSLLSDTTFRLRFGGLAGAVPRGWSAAGPGAPGAEPSASMTLLGGDSLRIVFRLVTLDSASVAYFAKRDVRDLAMLTRTIRDSTAGSVHAGIGRFRSEGRDFATYEIRANGASAMVAVFGAGGYYYECEASAAAGRTAGGEAGLTAAWKAVLRSLK